MCHCEKKSKCKCVERHVINSLPYTISKPGEYCLGKDFVWSDPSQSAISILSSDNVVLTFYQRQIEVNVATSAPVVKVFDSKNVQLKDLDVKGLGASTPLALLVQDSSNVEIRHASVEGAGFTLLDSSNLRFTDSSVWNGRTQVKNSQNVDLLRLQVDNTTSPGHLQAIGVFSFGSASPSENVRIADSDLRGNSTPNFDFFAQTQGVVFVGSFGDEDTKKPGAITRSVLVENNLISGNWCCILQIALNCTVRTNTILAEQDNALAIILRNNNNTVVSENTIYLQTNPWVGLGIEHYDTTLLPFMSNLPLTIGNHMISNTISSDGTVGSIEGTTYGGYAFSAAGQGLGALFNTYEKNQATNLSIGFTDSSFVPAIGAKCTVFRENIANGNGTNFIIDTAAPFDSIDVNNVDGCSGPVTMAALARGTSSLENLAARFQRRFQK